MNREKTNYAKIVGKVLTNQLEEKVNRRGKTYMGGFIELRVKQEVNGVETISDIPVNVYVEETTKDGKPSVDFDKIKNAMHTLKSISSVGEEEADYLMVSGKNILGENVFVSKATGALIEKAPSFSSRFLNEMRPTPAPVEEATFDAEVLVLKKGYVLDADGLETDKYKLEVAFFDYRNTPQVLPLVVYDKEYINWFQNNVNVIDGQHDMLRLTGLVNFTVIEEVRIEKPAIGAPIQKVKSTTVRELVVEGAFAPFETLTTQQVKEVLASRVERIQAEKARGEQIDIAPAQPTREQVGF